MAEVKITALKNGQYEVEGPVALVYDAAPVAADKNPFFLCRRGASTNKPFCDGMHTKIGFQAAAESVPASREGI